MRLPPYTYTYTPVPVCFLWSRVVLPWCAPRPRSLLVCLTLPYTVFPPSLRAEISQAACEVLLFVAYCLLLYIAFTCFTFTMAGLPSRLLGTVSRTGRPAYWVTSRFKLVDTWLSLKMLPLVSFLLFFYDAMRVVLFCFVAWRFLRLQSNESA